MVNVKNLKEGSIVKLDYSPSRGHEQRGYRPAVIISNPNAKGMPLNGMVALAPITSSIKEGFPAHVKLDDSTQTKGSVLLDQLRWLDLGTREFTYVEKMSKKKFEECKAVTKALLFNE